MGFLTFTAWSGGIKFLRLPIPQTGPLREAHFHIKETSTGRRTRMASHLAYTDLDGVIRCPWRHPLLTVMLSDMVPIFVGGESFEDIIQKTRWFFIARRFGRRLKPFLLKKQVRRATRCVLRMFELRILPRGLEANVRAILARELGKLLVPNDFPLRTLGLVRNAKTTALSTISWPWLR